jgi:hypothetical protein
MQPICEGTKNCICEQYSDRQQQREVRLSKTAKYPHCRGAPDRCRSIQASNVGAIFKDDTGAKKSYA